MFSTQTNKTTSLQPLEFFWALISSVTFFVLYKPDLQRARCTCADKMHQNQFEIWAVHGRSKTEHGQVFGNDLRSAQAHFQTQYSSKISSHLYRCLWFWTLSHRPFWDGSICFLIAAQVFGFKNKSSNSCLPVHSLSFIFTILTFC